MGREVGADRGVEADYDHLALSAVWDPFETINRVREECPVAHSPHYDGFWLLSRYEDVCAAARDTDRFRSEPGITIPHVGFPLPLSPIELDPPRHKLVRRPLTDLFTPGAVASYEPDIRRIVTQLLDKMIPDGGGDLAQGLTIPMPAQFVVRMLELPEADIPRFHDWAVRIVSVGEARDVVPEVFEYLNALYERARAGEPVGEIATRVLGMEIDGKPCDNIWFCLTIATLFTAGLDTTSNGGAYILELLSRDHDLRDQLIAGLDNVFDMIDELLRYLSPVPVLNRTTTEDVEIDGQVIPKGERVQLNWIAANHDPEHFPDPETIDLNREASTQVAFGHGIHRCLGQHLARLELTVLLQEVLTRIPDYKVDLERVERYPSIARGISSLPATW
jgi:cytochrome P450